MLKERSMKTASKPSFLLRDTTKLRSSMDSVQSDTKSQDQDSFVSLSESCNFAERNSLPFPERIFKKSSGRIGDMGENVSPNVNLGRKCQNHENKNSQFKVVTEGDTMYYCQRCAISLASQGFNVCRVQNLQKISKNSRPIEVEFLLDHIQLLRENLKKRVGQSRRAQMEKKQRIQRIQEQIKSFFQQLQTAITDVKKAFIKEFERQRDMLTNEEPRGEKIFSDGIKELDEIAQEIKKELPAVEQSRPSDYKQRLNGYRSRLENYRKILSQTHRSDVKLTVRLPNANPLIESIRSFQKWQLFPNNQIFSFSKSTTAKESLRAVSQFIELK